MGQGKTHEEFMIDFKERQPELFDKTEVLGKYINSKTKIKCRCLLDGYEWDARPSHLLKGHGCHRCARLERYTTETFRKKIKEIHPDLNIKGDYLNNHTPILYECTKCGYEWEALPCNLLKGHGCARCANREKYTTESFKEKLKTINPNIEVSGEYIAMKKPMLAKCLFCGYEWDAIPAVLTDGGLCPSCYPHQTSWLQEELAKYFSDKYPSTITRDKTLIGKELDIVIPELNIAIEPGSWYWHFEKENRLFNDYQKQLLCEEKGYKCITIYDKCTDPEFPWFPCIIYDVDIGEHRELLQDVIENIEDIIMEV